jgi:hypothetical protein
MTGSATQSGGNANDWIAASQDELSRFRQPLNVIASEAKQSSEAHAGWIASSQELLAMTEAATPMEL